MVLTRSLSAWFLPGAFLLPLLWVATLSPSGLSCPYLIHMWSLLDLYHLCLTSLYPVLICTESPPGPYIVPT
jgi:hypothetical protein